MGYTVKVKNDVTQEESEVPVQLINNSSSNVDEGVTKGLGSVQIQQNVADVGKMLMVNSLGKLALFMPSDEYHDDPVV